MAEKVFLNDGIVDSDKAVVSISDSGLLYGMGLFETMRSCGGVVFAIDDHIERLFASAGALSINTGDYDGEFIRAALGQVLEANGLSDARIRLTLTSGSIGNVEEQRPTLFITATEFQEYPKEYYEKGATVALTMYKQEVSNPTFGHKTINYLPRMLALNTARGKGAVESLWFTADNRLAEGCVSNVFLVKGSKVFTPPLDTPVLGGVARKNVCELAAGNGIEVEEKELFVDDLLEADEVFLTNVIMGVMPVTKIEAKKVGDGKVGEVSRKLKQLFDRAVNERCTDEG